MKVPFVDLRAQHAAIRDEIDAAVATVLDEATFILGPAVEEFEAAFATATERRFCVGVNSGTSALHLALLGAGVGPGDEVVTTPNTWISTCWAIAYCGARPVFADIDPTTGNLDPAAAEQAIGHRTRALLPVDIYGNPAAWGAFEEIAARRDIALIEDAAQAHGARLGNRPAGGFGMSSCFSFYPSKNLGAAGEAGAVLTDDPTLAERLRRLRDHSQNPRHHHTETGFNYRMDGLQAAVLGVKLRHLAAWNAARAAAAMRYRELLAGVPGLRLPGLTPDADPAWHIFVIRIPDRDRVAQQLAAAGIDVGIHYPTPVHLQPAFASLGYARGDLPHAEALADECLSLPIFPEITEPQQLHVARVLREALPEARRAG